VNDLPVLELAPSGRAARGSVLTGPLPASGVRVLDLTRVIAGPVCTRTLAAHGAEVLRIDSPQLPENEHHTLDSLVGKRSALLELQQPEHRRRLDELIAGADVVVQGYRPGALARFGLAPDELNARHPGLVVLSLSAWGHTGPWASRRGFDSLVQAASGIAYCEATGGETPGVLPAQLLDHATGYLAAAAVMTALTRRHNEGSGWHARVSLAQTAAWLLRQPIRPKTRSVEIDPTPYSVELDGPAGAVTLISPPGQLGGRPLEWPGPPARYGADTPQWLTPAGARSARGSRGRPSTRSPMMFF
jgi:crotonobetainyl-CoA:carnitine CoA-transferase CaiB-like acyl-CoA transferase